MVKPIQQTIRCPACGQSYNGEIRTIIDAAQDPQGKQMLIAGQLNVQQCPHCGATTRAAAPILYHDADKELLISFVPMELNMPREEQDRVIGAMLNDLTASIPKEQFRAYMFKPRSALTMQGLVNQILEADGIDPQKVEEQRKRLQLVQMFLDASSVEAIQALVKEFDEQIDETFFQTLSMFGQRMVEEGQVQIAQRVAAIQQILLSETTYGKGLQEEMARSEAALKELTADIQALGENITRDDMIDIVTRYADSEVHLQALASLARPAFDEQFFQEFTARIAQAPTDERDRLQAAFDRLQELVQMIDQQQQAIAQRAVQFLQAIANSPNPDEFIRQNLHLVDDTFMSILHANIEHALKEQNAQAFGMLKQVEEKVTSALREQMQPELRFINDVLNAQSQEEATQMIAEQAPQFGEGLLEMIDAVYNMFAQQGNAEVAGRLQFIRQEAQRALGQ